MKIYNKKKDNLKNKKVFFSSSIKHIFYNKSIKNNIFISLNYYNLLVSDSC